MAPGAMHRRLPGMPSPLSKISDSKDGKEEVLYAKKKVHMSPDVANDPAVPCFIHSGLDRQGTLQDWLRHNQADQGFSPRPKHRSQQQAQKSAQKSSLARQPRPQPLTPAAPKLPKPQTPDGEQNGYESDKSGIDCSQSLEKEGPLLSPEIEIDVDTQPDADDDDEEATSLTRQLAATAQGVREVSKQLGRTKVHSRIQHILIVTKARDNRLISLTRDLALYLMQRGVCNGSPPTAPADQRAHSPGRGMVVYVDAQLRKSKRFDAAGMQRDYPELFEPVLRRRASRSANASTTSISTMASSYSGKDNRDTQGGEGQLRYWTPEMCSNTPQLFDFVITLGGDGTVLFTSWLFQKIVPPVLPFALGSLGFLTNFNFKDYKTIVNKVVDEGIRVNLRMRFSCTVYRAVAPNEPTVVNSHGRRKAIRKPGGEILVQQVDREGWEALEGGTPLDSEQDGSGDKDETTKEDREVLCFTTRPVEQFEVLNDLVVDRGPSPFVSLLEVFGDDHHLTTVQADGLTVSTPTGSTAYSLSAGGSLVHPGIPAILLTPICPHTLSFRPMLLPDGMELRVCVPYNSRSTAWASFDGRGRVELKQGDHIKITASKFPFPTVCADKQSTDWFRSISRTLRWNDREKQKSFVVFEEADSDAKAHSDEGGSDDDFDIDDRSTAGERTPDVQPEAPDSDKPVERVRLVDSGPVPVTAPQPLPRGRRRLIEDSEYDRSGVQSPNRFASGSYTAPPPLSQRHLVKALEKCETDMASIKLSEKIREQKEAMERETQRTALAQDEAALREALARVTAARAKLDDSLEPSSSPSPPPPPQIAEPQGPSPSDSISSFGDQALTPQHPGPSSATANAMATSPERGRRPTSDEAVHRDRESSLHRNVSEATLAPLPERDFSGSDFHSFAGDIGRRASGEFAGGDFTVGGPARHGQGRGAGATVGGTPAAPRQGRSRSRGFGSSSRAGSRSGGAGRGGEDSGQGGIQGLAPGLSPGMRSHSRTRGRAKAFAFFGNDASASEISEGE